MRVLFFSLMWVYYHSVNRDRAHGKEDDKIAGMSEEDIQEMGEKSPRFVYSI